MKSSNVIIHLKATEEDVPVAFGSFEQPFLYYRRIMRLDDFGQMIV